VGCSKTFSPENLGRPTITGLPKLAIRIEAAAKFFTKILCAEISNEIAGTSLF
jgi:hypothetical protein